jgi:Raf kinase inhibitor-like YbhB/YbcL family protein
MKYAGGPVFTKAMSNTSNMSPAMMWSGEPSGTKSFAISMIDTQTPPSKTPPLKAGTSTKAHWVIYNIPATAHALPANLPAMAMLPDPMGAFASATFSSKKPSFGYFGPGGATSVYKLTLYALDVDKLPGIAAGAPQMSTSDALRTGGNLASHVLGKVDYLAAGTNGGF